MQFIDDIIQSNQIWEHVFLNLLSTMRPIPINLVCNTREKIVSCTRVRVKLCIIYSHLMARILRPNCVQEWRRTYSFGIGRATSPYLADLDRGGEES